ncbi:EBNA-1 nuclear protein [Myxococcus stipitatus DSM 14675]|uniref:EBNA-1 nuclear protein n=1 Tax=Myxococcus stipitatus (strain DSM 14675 / JCM 12634 / Mx s8) TaxID=1278073 RepID=L7UG82_MYXSD|nr:N-acetyltransferase DgcN [Myxococcus stipitatus]AGC46900.1 EBNA-1 nuclear protein [Myxococcus stipitatus DSM 14675]
MEIQKPYLLFLGDVPDQLAAKTAHGIVDWRPEWCVGQLRLPGCKADCGLTDLDIAQAKAKGVKTLIVGVANAGGVLPEHWVGKLVEALDAGMDVATGLHRRLSSFPAIAEAARRNGRALHDVRIPDMEFATGKGTRRQGLRLLTVGTDCSVGKKYTALALEKEMRARGLQADFRATGQTGIFISGRGVAIDAVVSDFVAGAAEWLSPENAVDHWDLVEGQGSLFHPSFAGVTLGLLHGAQPDAFVVCHEPTRTKMRGVQHALPSIQAVIERTVLEGQLTNPGIRCTGLAINTEHLAEPEALGLLERLGREHGLPCVDPIRTGVGPLVDELVRRFPARG